MERLKRLSPSAAVLIVGLVPLVVLPGAFARFHAGKWLAVLVLVPLGVALCAATGELRWPHRNWFIGWLSILALATVLGVAPWMSVAGSPNRNAGLIAALVGTGAFIIGASVGRNPVAQRLVLRFAFLVGAVVALVGILEFAGVDLLGFGDLGETSRARSTWGSATFAAAHMVIVLPIAVAHIRSRSGVWRNTAMVSTVVIAAGLLLTGTRGAWLGVAVASIPLSIAWRATGASGQVGVEAQAPGTETEVKASKRAPLPRPVVVGAVVLVVIIGGAIAVPALGRSSGVGRLDLWSTAVPVALDRPVLGSGPDTQRVVLPSGIDTEFEAKHGSNELHDRAHNIVLDTVVTSGLIGLLAFGSLIVVLGVSIYRGAKGQLVPVAVAAGLLGYLVSLVFAFGDPVVDPIAWLLSGLVLGAVATTGSTEPQRAEATTIGPKRPPFRIAVAATLMLVGIGGAMWGGGEVVAEYRLATAMDARDAGSLDDALETLSDAASVAPARFDLDQIASRVVTRAATVGQLPGDGQAAIADAASRLDRAQRVAGDDPDVLMDRAEFMTATEDPRGALEVYERVLKLYPNSFRAHLGQGVAAAGLNQFDLAERAWKRAAELGPRDARSRVNLGLLYEQTGRPDDAAAAFKAALKVDPQSSSASRGLARVTPPAGN